MNSRVLTIISFRVLEDRTNNKNLKKPCCTETINRRLLVPEDYPMVGKLTHCYNWRLLP